MDCRETQTLLTAFHDGELPAADRARVEEHLRGCPECGAMLADLARADQAAGVPDPGPAYWDRFNARVMDRVERETDGSRGTILRPKHGWMRQQLRYLVPAAAVAALVVGIVRYGGMNPGAPVPAVPPPAREPSTADSAGARMTKAEPEPRAAKRPESAAVARRVPPASVAGEQGAAVTRKEQGLLQDHPLPAANGETARDRAAVPAAAGGPSPPQAHRGAPGGSPPVSAEEGMPPAMQSERRKMAEPASRRTEQEGSGKAKSASGMKAGKEASTGSPCELAHTLAEGERIREAEYAQRACLAEDLPAPSREKGLVFLAELLDRQARFAEADAVIAEVDRRFPQSPPLESYRQRRPMVQKHPMAVPVTR